MSDPIVAKALIERIQELRDHAQQAREHLDEVQGKLDAYETTLADLTRGTNGRELSRSVASRDELRGLSILDAAILIAGRNGGEFRFTPARRAMMDAGLLPTHNRNAANQLYAELSNSSRFERLATRGHYRLLSEDDEDDDWEEDGEEVDPPAVPIVPDDLPFE